MSEKRVCDGCKKTYWWPGAKWQHAKCANDIVTAGLGSKAGPVAGSVTGRVDNDDDQPLGRKQRWDRQRYNTYQKALMRARRAKSP